MNKYLISGIGPDSNGGVGRLMRALIPEYEELGYKIICKREKRIVDEYLNNGNYLPVLQEFFTRGLSYIQFRLRCMTVSGAEVVFLHPQTAGFSLLFSLMKKNDVSMYVMDSSFFCIQSYNTHPERFTECLRCLENIDPHSMCLVFPGIESVSKRVSYLKKLQLSSGDINFLAQNRNQMELLKKHFGESIDVRVIGMNTGEVADIARFPVIRDAEEVYDVVYHGAPIKAKGVHYFIALAEKLEEYSFFMPASKDVVKKEISRLEFPVNVHFEDITWENGLSTYIASARLVVHPSMWSAPIEGALLKSAALNRNIATVRTRYGYEAEFKGAGHHLRLPEDVATASEKIRMFLESESCDRSS